MELGFDDTTQLLQRTVQQVLHKHRSVDRLRDVERTPPGYDELLWKQITDLGWPLLAVPADRGGGGGRFRDLIVAATEIGRSAVAVPFVATAGAAVVCNVLADHGPRRRVLDRLSAGAAAALAAPPLTANPPQSDHHLVEWGAQADLVVAAVRTDGDEWVLVALDGQHTLGSRDAAAVDNVRVSALTDEEALRAGSPLRSAPVSGPRLRSVLALVQTLRCASLVGTAARALELTTEHVSTREQFGQPLGRFQAVQQMCATIAMHVDAATLAVQQAASLDDRGQRGDRAAAIAAYAASRAAELAVVTAAQLHGGIGFMQEYELQFHFRRAKADQLRLGGEQALLERVAETTVHGEPRGWELP